jgi:hypothetical protein
MSKAAPDHVTPIGNDANDHGDTLDTRTQILLMVLIAALLPGCTKRHEQGSGSGLNISMNGGVGYLIPRSITNLINSVLSALNIRYRVTGEGGIEPSEPLTIINKTSQLGGCKPDEDTSAKGSMSGPV